MADAVAHICEMISRLPAHQRDEVIFVASLAIGCRFVPTSIETDQNTPQSEKYVFPGLVDFRDKLLVLVEEMGVCEELLIPGILLYLVDHFHRTADTMPESIDHHLDIIRGLEEELAKPLSDRQREMTDAELHEQIKQAKEWLGNKPSQRKDAEEIANYLEAEWQRVFTHDYWRKRLWAGR